MLKGIEQTSLNTIVQVRNIDALLQEAIIITKEKAAYLYSKDLIEILFEQPYCKIEYLVDKLNIERKAASRYLQKLEDIGILTLKKFGKENIYINSRLYDLLKGNE